ncbi:MAG: hypothetical protein RL511_783 [Bacteroidota bacterium]|jgi:hypothetical protein
MSYIKLTISSLIVTSIFAACSNADTKQCACLQQAQKVNRLTQAVWSANASHNDTLLLKAALQKKADLCKKLLESTPEQLQELKASCPQ